MTKLHEGLTRKAPKPEDASMKNSGGSVDDGATRSGVTKNPKTLGPRNA